MDVFPLVVTGLSFVILIYNIAGNLLVVLVICKNKKRSSANAFLLWSLACSDLGLAIAIFLYTIFISYKITNGNFSDFILHALNFCLLVSCIGCGKVLCYFEALRALDKNREVVFAVLTFAAVLSCPGYFFELQLSKYNGQKLTSMNETTDTPTWFKPVSIVYSYIILLFGLVLPATIMIFCYSNVIYHVWFNTDATKLTNTALL